MRKISPSILASDFSRLGEESIACAEAGAHMLHIDVMDGHFVPNITLGAPIVKCIRKCTDIEFDVHLMISEPDKYIPDFVKAGADIITVHAEADGDTEKTVELISSLGVKPAVALKPATPAEVVFPYLDKLAMVLVMTVEPGFGGQKFMPDQVPKIAELRRMIDESGRPCELEVDGGINTETVKPCIAAGADVFVAGSAVFNAADRAAAISGLRG